LQHLTRVARAVAVPLVTVALLSGCGPVDQGDNVDSDQLDAVDAPELGACRILRPDDVAQSSNATRTVPCFKPHTAETYAVGPLPDRFQDAPYGSKELGIFAYQTCASAFRKFLGADESLVMRTILSWAWFRPSEKAWDDGARWYRCDVVGGGDESKEYVDLPRTAKSLLRDQPDEWMACANGLTVESVKVTCDQPHTWRAVTTIKLGEPGDAYPGDRLVKVRTRDFCSKSVGAWLTYPDHYDYGFTWFHEGEWDAGNRRSICWAKTDH
jgi:hypothetical protein